MTVPLFADVLAPYLDGLVPPRPAELQVMEDWAGAHKFPIIGPASGQACYLLARLIGARRIFEMGSGYGYSTAWFARAVRENGGGEVHHVVWDDGLSTRARGHLAALGLDDLIRYHVAEAVATLTDSTGLFDIIFNDIEKDSYPASIPIIEQRLRPGGLLIVDNMLWHGQIFDKDDRQATTTGVREATRLLTSSPNWITSLLPIRDGVMVAMKR